MLDPDKLEEKLPELLHKASWTVPLSPDETPLPTTTSAQWEELLNTPAPARPLRLYFGLGASGLVAAAFLIVLLPRTLDPSQAPSPVTLPSPPPAPEQPINKATPQPNPITKAAKPQKSAPSEALTLEPVPAPPISPKASLPPQPSPRVETTLPKNAPNASTLSSGTRPEPFEQLGGPQGIPDSAARNDLREELKAAKKESDSSSNSVAEPSNPSKLTAPQSSLAPLSPPTRANSKAQSRQRSLTDKADAEDKDFAGGAGTGDNSALSKDNASLPLYTERLQQLIQWPMNQQGLTILSIQFANSESVTLVQSGGELLDQAAFTALLQLRKDAPAQDRTLYRLTFDGKNQTITLTEAPPPIQR